MNITFNIVDLVPYKGVSCYLVEGLRYGKRYVAYKPVHAERVWWASVPYGKEALPEAEVLTAVTLGSQLKRGLGMNEMPHKRYVITDSRGVHVFETWQLKAAERYFHLHKGYYQSTDGDTTLRLWDSVTLTELARHTPAKHAA